MNILYADDDADDRFLLAEAFKEVDSAIECTTVSDGRAVFDTLQQAHHLPDCIFLDINMPVMSGFECLSLLKADNRLSTIPVIIYTTTNDAKEILRCYQLGAFEYIHKPHSMRTLCELLATFISKLQNKGRKE